MSSVRLRALSSLLALALTGCGASPESAKPAPPSDAPQSSPPAPRSSLSTSGSSPLAPVGNDVTSPPDITDADLPPLPATPYPAAAPMEIVRAVFTFAAKHPEVLNQVPCFCGCQSRGHRHNDDCFVKARDARGRPTEWELHGVG